MHISCLVTYKEQNGYWFYVCRFCMNCTALRHTVTVTGLYHVLKQGNSVNTITRLYIVQPRTSGSIASMQETLLHSTRTGCGFRQAPYKFGSGGSFHGVKRPGLQASSYITQCLGCKPYGATPTLPHMA